MSNMFLWNTLTFVLLVLLTISVSAAGEDVPAAVDSENGQKSTNKPVTKPATQSTNTNATVINKNTTDSGNVTHFMDGPLSMFKNKGMLMRSFYVLLGLTSLVILYFGVKAWRTRRRKSKSRKYGLITSRDADLEMEPLDRDMDDDDDMTVFEVNGRQK